MVIPWFEVSGRTFGDRRSMSGGVVEWLLKGKMEIIQKVSAMVRDNIHAFDYRD